MSKKNKKYSILKAASWYTVGNILVKSVSFFVLPIFTALMSTTEYGIYSVYTSYLSIFEVVILLGLSSTIVIAKYDKDTDFNSYMSTVITIPVIVTLVAGLLLNIYLMFSGGLLSMNQTLWNCLLVTSATAAVGNIIGARLIIDAEYKKYMLYSMITVVVNVGTSLLLCYTIYRDHDIHMARVIGQMLSTIASMIYIKLATKTKVSVNFSCIKNAFAWGIPLLFHTLATIILTQSDRIVIRYMDSYAAAGIYSIAVTLITIPLTLYTSISNAWTPWFYEKLEQKEYGTIRKTNNTYVFIFSVIIALFMLVSPELIHFFTDSSYWDSVYCLVPLSISVFGELLYSFPVCIEYYNKKTQWIMWGTVSVTGINIILDIAFVYIWGFVGAAYATTLSKLILFVFHFILAKKLETNSVFSMLESGGCMVTLLGINCLTITTVNNIVPRIIVCLVIVSGIAVFGVRNKQEIIRQIKR